MFCVKHEYFLSYKGPLSFQRCHVFDVQYTSGSLVVNSTKSIVFPKPVYQEPLEHSTVTKLPKATFSTLAHILIHSYTMQKGNVSYFWMACLCLWCRGKTGYFVIMLTWDLCVLPYKWMKVFQNILNIPKPPSNWMCLFCHNWWRLRYRKDCRPSRDKSTSQ